MADDPTTSERPRLARRGAWDGIARPGRTGRADGPAGVVARPLDGLGLAAVSVARDGRDALAARLLAGPGIVLPDPLRSASSGGLDLVWTGRQHWTAVTAARSGIPDLAASLGDAATVVNQSDGCAVLRLEGVAVRDALAKGCPVDLHPRAFAVGQAASTTIEHVPVQVWLAAGSDVLRPGFHVLVARSLAPAFWSGLGASAAEFGLVTEAGDVPGEGASPD